MDSCETSTSNRKSTCIYGPGSPPEVESPCVWHVYGLNDPSTRIESPCASMDQVQVATLVVRPVYKL